MNLPAVRQRTFKYFDLIRDNEGPIGCYRMGAGQRPDLYSSVDVVLMRTIMGENLRETVSPRDRAAWSAHINSFANNNFGVATDGTYFDTFGHSLFHANGQVVGALGPLGGKQPFPVRLYEAFDTPKKVGKWLENIDWSMQWPSSHLFWGGMVCFSFSAQCTPQWVDEVVGWLDANLDPQTGWWRCGVAHTDRNQPLGGGAHIWLIYQHQNRVFPFPERLIDSILGLQLPSGRWNQALDIEAPRHHYLELDALYGLWLMGRQNPDYRADDVRRCAHRYADQMKKQFQDARLFDLHPHWVLSFIGSFGLLQRLAPDRFQDSATWTDIFSDASLHNTRAVERLIEVSD